MRDNRIESLILEAQLPARIWVHIVNEDLRVPARILETRRDRARGLEVAASGAGLAFGFHHLGRAVDWGCFDQHGAYITDGTHPLYRKCGLIWEALGWNWGGRWQRPDWGHAQMSNGIDRFNEWWAKHPGSHPVTA